jgi:hypothetical protein
MSRPVRCKWPGSGLAYLLTELPIRYERPFSYKRGLSTARPAGTLNVGAVEWQSRQ